MSDGAYVIVGNIAAPDSALRTGARVVIKCIPGNPDRVMVRGLSRGGRRITKWTATGRLKNVRVAWEHGAVDWARFETRAEAAQVIAARFPAMGTRLSSTPRDDAEKAKR